MKSPAEDQEEAARLIGYGAIWLRRVDNYAVVEIEHGGEWHEIVRVAIDENFSHSIYPVGIISVLARKGVLETKLGQRLCKAGLL